MTRYDGSGYFPPDSFGKRIGQRVNDCVILEPAEMIVVSDWIGLDDWGKQKLVKLDDCGE